jgi:hypothetical protein
VARLRGPLLMSTKPRREFERAEPPGHLELPGHPLALESSRFWDGSAWHATCCGANVAVLAPRSAASLAAAALLVLLTAVGCRSELHLCGQGCGGAGEGASAEAGGADGGGAGGTDLAEAAGAGGRSPGGCGTDRDCADGSVCNGDERCDAGRCGLGLSLECDSGTVCTETGDRERCVYEHRSPWLLLLTTGKILGLPTAELGKRPLLTLGERTSNGLLVGMNTVSFSSGGQHALVEFLAQDLGQELLSLSFDRGIPEPARGFPNLPNWGRFSDVIFSRDGQRGLISEQYSGTYLLDLSGANAKSALLDVPQFYDYDGVAFCSDNYSWLRAGPQTTLYTLADGQPVSSDLGHEYDYDVELSLDARKIWLGGDSPRLVDCAPGATSQPLGIVADSAEFSPDSRWLLLSLADGSTRLLSVAASLVATEAWSGAGVTEWVWSDDAASLLLRTQTDVASSYGYFDLSETQPVLRTLALAGDASILGCGSHGCLASSSDQARPAQALLFQAFDAEAKPSVVGGDAAEPASVVLADFARNRLVLQRSNPLGNELRLTDFTGAAERHLFDWVAGSVEVALASDDSGVLIRVKDNIEFSNFWVAFPATADDEPTVVTLDVPAYRSEFQPWP